MIEKKEDGRYLLSFETNAVIRRIPLPRSGVAKNGRPWTLGGALVEAYDENENESAQLYVITWDALMVEQIERLGVGKRVRMKCHVDTHEKYDNYNVSVILDEISLPTDGENFLVGKKKGENK